MPTYRGSCHCGAVTFSLVSDITELTTCDCSLCRQKNALMTKVPESALTVESGEDLLSVYEWNTHRAKHFFCSRRQYANPLPTGSAVSDQKRQAEFSKTKKALGDFKVR